MHEIAKLTLENFQGHAKSIIEPGGPGTLTVITGPTDAGKSAVFRALRWVYYNTPSGDSFKRVGTDHVSVTVETLEGRIITRRRTATTNRYIVDGTVLEGFGSTVPMEVQEATGVRPLRLADQELRVNLAHQKDPDFLGAGTSGPSRAKALGIFGGTEIVDRAARDLGIDLYRWRDRLKGLDDEIARLERELKQYEHLPQLEWTLRRLQEILPYVQDKDKCVRQLQFLKLKFNRIAELQAAAEETLARMGGVPEAAHHVRQALEKSASLTKAQALADALQRLDGEMDRVTDILTRTKNLASAAFYLGAAVGAHDRLRRLQLIGQWFGEIATAAKQLGQRMACLGSVEQATVHLETTAKAAEKLVRVSSLGTAYHDVRWEIQKTINRLSILDITLQRSRFPELIAAAERWKRLTTTVQVFQDSIAQMVRVCEAKEKHERILFQLRVEYYQALLNAGRCPTCGCPIDAAHLHQLEEVV